MRAVSTVLLYLKGARSYTLMSYPCKSSKLNSYAGEDCEGEEISKCRSRTAMHIRYGSAFLRALSSIQMCITLRSADGEYMTVSETIKN